MSKKSNRIVHMENWVLFIPFLGGCCESGWCGGGVSANHRKKVYVFAGLYYISHSSGVFSFWIFRPVCLLWYNTAVFTHICSNAPNRDTCDKLIKIEGSGLIFVNFVLTIGSKICWYYSTHLVNINKSVYVWLIEEKDNEFRLEVEHNFFFKDKPGEGEK